MSKDTSVSSGDNYELRSSCTLERLPSLVRLQVLQNLALPDIFALLAASPVFLGDYSIDRASIVRISLPLTLENVAAEATAVYETSLDSFQDTRSKDTITQVVGGFETQRWQHQPPAGFPLSPAKNNDALTMARFHMQIIRPLVDVFAKQAWGNLVLTLRWEDSPEAAEAARKLLVSRQRSASEERRIVRALYRFQLFCNLFGAQRPSNGTSLELTEVDALAIFFSIFEPWEVEEIFFTFQIARGIVSDAIDKVEYDLDERHPMFEDQGPPTPEGAFDMNNSWIKAMLLQGTISRGLGLVQRLNPLPEDHDELVALIREHITQSTSGLLDEIVFYETAQLRRREAFPTERDEREQRRDPLPFDGEAKSDASSSEHTNNDGNRQVQSNLYPPLAWTLIWKESYSNMYGGYIPLGIRSWGYMMWDASLLRDTGADEVLMKQWEREWEGAEPRDDLI